MKKQLLILCLSVLITCACKKSSTPDVLPDASQVGANTFGALIDGKVFIPKKKSGSTGAEALSPVYGVLPYLQSVGLLINASNNVTDPYMGIELSSTGPLQQGQTYSLQQSSTNIANAVCFLQADDYEVTSPLTGQLTITKLDPVNRIISGTFFFDAISRTGSKVSVTDGRFDCNF